jgi:hypothetical protein
MLASVPPPSAVLMLSKQRQHANQQQQRMALHLGSSSGSSTCGSSSAGSGVCGVVMRAGDWCGVEWLRPVQQQQQRRWQQRRVEAGGTWVCCLGLHAGRAYGGARYIEQQWDCERVVEQRRCCAAVTNSSCW